VLAGGKARVAVLFACSCPLSPALLGSARPPRRSSVREAGGEARAAAAAAGVLPQARAAGAPPCRSCAAGPRSASVPRPPHRFLVAESRCQPNGKCTEGLLRFRLIEKSHRETQMQNRKQKVYKCRQRRREKEEGCLKRCQQPAAYKPPSAYRQSSIGYRHREEEGIRKGAQVPAFSRHREEVPFAAVPAGRRKCSRMRKLVTNRSQQLSLSNAARIILLRVTCSGRLPLTFEESRRSDAPLQEESAREPRAEKAACLSLATSAPCAGKACERAGQTGGAAR